MGKRITIGSEFLSMTMPIDKPWLRNIYWGLRDGTGNHGHLVASGAIIVGSVVSAETWYVRDTNKNEFVKNGSELFLDASKLLSNTLPPTLREFQHPENPLFWNIGSIDSLFLANKKRLSK